VDRMNLPNFMCLGASKSGTTTLYDILRQHPDIFVPSFKEPHFFDIPSVYKNGLEWYQRTYYSGIKEEKLSGDFTPTYLFDSDAPKRIFDTLGGNIKFIVILRNPVDRAYSHYLHSKRDEHEDLEFIDAIQNEKDRLNKNSYLSYLRNSYIRQGLYSKMLSRYFELFSQEQFLILNFEKDFLENREETIGLILDFLNLQKVPLKIDISSNKASKARFIWLKKMMKKTGWWRRLLKQIIPSLKVRQIIKNRIQRLNISTFVPVKLSPSQRSVIYKTYFKQDIESLEILLGKKMFWDE